MAAPLMTDQQRAALRAAAGTVWRERREFTHALPSFDDLEEVRIVADLLELAEEGAVSRPAHEAEVENGIRRFLADQLARIDDLRGKADFLYEAQRRGTAVVSSACVALDAETFADVRADNEQAIEEMEQEIDALRSLRVEWARQSYETKGIA